MFHIVALSKNAEVLKVKCKVNNPLAPVITHFILNALYIKRQSHKNWKTLTVRQQRFIIIIINT